MYKHGTELGGRHGGGERKKKQNFMIKIQSQK